jgi:hypothetical protein
MRAPRKTREAIFKQIGNVQLPMPGIDAAHDPERCMRWKLLAACDARTIGCRSTRTRCRWRRIGATAPKGSADMMALDASRHLWTARIDPRRRTFAAGIYTHVRDRWGVFHHQPIVLNERQAGVAVEGVEQHNRAEDRIRVSLLAVDTHGVTSVAIAIAKLLGFDQYPRLRDLRERKLYVPSRWPLPRGHRGRSRAACLRAGYRARLGGTGARGGFDPCCEGVSALGHPALGFSRGG